MAPRKRAAQSAQAWVELRSDDPEAVSALAVAQAHLPAGRALHGLRRIRLLELLGPLPPRADLEGLLHRSTQFYNPHKERCTVRVTSSDPAPVRAGERLVLVFERGGERRAAAERWWLHETGVPVEVREGVVWAASLPETEGVLEDLALVQGRRHGLLCNPHSQECRFAGGEIPLAWMTTSAAPEEGRNRDGRRGPQPEEKL
ncbi:MAG TPA: hypothetical protein VGK93_05155 [Candidatus Eisenbacteria bacterium]|jgi:hypothetical protein